jgi:hypothetical protein
MTDQLAEIRARDALKGHSEAGITMTRAEMDRRILLRMLDDALNGPESDPAAEYGGDLTPPLCCCKRGAMCASCGTGRHWGCPDRDDPDYEDQDDE